MFGSSKNYELHIQHLQESLDKMTEEKKKAEKDLENARAKISELETKLTQTDLEVLKKETRETLAEYEGLKDLYLRKNQDFDSSLQSKEESYAKEEALARHHLKEEIAQQKLDTEKYVSETVKTFNETYNYYLNQIKVLMNALGSVASDTGLKLFSGEELDLKTEFGREMVNALKQETDTLPQGSGDRILIGTSEEEAAAAEAKKAVAKPAKKPSAKKPAAKKPAAKKPAAKAASAKKGTAGRPAGKTARAKKPAAAAAETPAEVKPENPAEVKPENPAEVKAENPVATVTDEVKEVKEVKEAAAGAAVEVGDVVSIQ